MCGIFGTINANKPKRFRYTAFAGLGIINDSRGGDSCGIFIDGKYEYGVYTKKFFKDFMLESKLLEEFRGQEVNIAIGHCRKASVGATTEANAQPVILKDENGNPEFVLIHNGTIKNYEELAKKYIPNIETKDMTDSQIMARIFYYKGYQVLSEYYGGSVFFIVDYRKGTPECRFFQGYSKNAEYSKEETQERPFYFAYRDGTLIFSSIYEMLAAACPGADIWEPAANTLYSYTAKGLISEKEYPRDKVTQTLPYKATPATTTYYGGSRAAVTGGNKTIAEKVEDRKHTSATGTTTTTTTSTTASSVTKSDNEKLPKDIKDQTVSNSDLLGKRLTYDYQTSRYQIDNKPLHGAYCLSTYGTIVDEDSFQAKNVIWFFCGIPFVNKGQYFYDRFRAICMDFKLTPSEFIERFPTVIRWYSSDRIFRDPLTNILVVATSPKERKPYTGMFMRLCEVYGSKFEKGLEMDHCVIDTDATSKVTFLNNENQGGSKINTETSIAKQIKKVCLELKKG